MTKLYQLQTVELEIAAGRQRCAEIEANLGESDALLQARRDLKAAQAEYQHWAIRSRDLELNLGRVNDQISANQDRLYGGSVTNPKELKDLQQKVDSLKKQQQDLEDQLLEAMLNSEDAQAQVEQSQTRLEQVKQDWEASQAALRQELVELQAHILENEEQRQNLRNSISADNLAAYSEILVRKGTPVVVKLVDGVCGFCAVSPSAQHLKKLKAARTLTLCANCERILFIP